MTSLEEDLDQYSTPATRDEDRKVAQAREQIIMNAADFGKYIAFHYIHCLMYPSPYLGSQQAAHT